MIRAVVLDIGGVLEIIDESVFPAPFLARHGLPPDALQRVELPGDPSVGELTEPQLRTVWAAGLGLDDAGADELMADYWRWYVGTPDPELLAWFARQRPARRTGILSNSSPGPATPREQETLTPDLVQPDPGARIQRFPRPRRQDSLAHPLEVCAEARRKLSRKVMKP